MSLPDSIDVDDLPPSAKYVVFALESADGSLTRCELLNQTGLPKRTLDRALNSLESDSIIRRDRDSEDLRYVQIQLNT